MLSLQEKQAIVAEVATVANVAQSAIAAEYRGLTVVQMTKLRKEARNAGVYLRVAKNTLVRRAVQGTSFACMSDALVGPLVFAFSQNDPASAARVMRDFAKDNDKLVVKVVALGGKLLSPSAVEALARMPTRDQALSILMATIKAPITMFVRTLAEPNNKLARTLAAVRDQKQAA